MVERVLGKDEVAGSIPALGSQVKSPIGCSGLTLSDTIAPT